MKRTKVVGFSVARMKRNMMAIVVTEQTNRLIEYALNKVQEIGSRINEYHSLNHMDRTGNLLDSLCWGVTYKGKLKASGFYRDQQATKESHLHEFFSSDVQDMFPIYGHGMAQEFLEGYGNEDGNGWTVFFAILADYWGYWEKGFRMKVKGPEKEDWDEDDVSHYTSRTFKFSVMTEFYDKVKRDLTPAKVRLKVSVPKYNTNKRNNLNRMINRYANNPYAADRHYRKYPEFKKRKK